MTVSLRLQPALLPSSSHLRRIPVSTGSRKITYLSEFVLHRWYYILDNQISKGISCVFCANAYPKVTVISFDIRMYTVNLFKKFDDGFVLHFGE